MPNPTGKTTTDLNLREGPGTQFAVIQILPARTPVEVFEQGLGDQGNWMRVTALGQAGHVHRNFVQLDDQGVDDGFIRNRTEGQTDASLAAPEHLKIVVPAGATGLDKLVANTWNRYGGLLAVLSDELHIDPGVSVAVLAVEAGGRCFAADGRMIIRFENHLFWDQWGRHQPDTFNRHFTFSPDKRWMEHRWRPAEDQPWREFHGSQSAEWEAFSFARGLDETAAKLSISMGGPQIVGFNYPTCGFESVHQMFEAFAGSERAQIVGFFDFVQGPNTNSRRVLALQTLDFPAFAALYNGPGQAARYGSLIQSAYEALKRLRPS